MNPVLRIKELGQLIQYEVYDYYDEPLFLAYRDELGHFYFARIVNEDTESNEWIFVAVSQNRFNMIRSGGLDINSAFSQAELGYCYHIGFKFGSQTPFFEGKINCESIPQSFLPHQGITLNLKTETLPKLSEQISERAIQTKRVLVNLHLEFPNNLRTEAPISKLGEILIATQDLLNAIGQAQKERATTRGVVPQNILSTNEMLLSGIGAGSFELELASATLSNLLDEAAIADSINEMVKLIQIGTDGEKLKNRLSQLKIRVASKYLGFLTSISNEVISTEVKWASPLPGKFGKAEITKLNAQIAADSIKRIEENKFNDIEVIGQLVGASLSQHDFEIIASEKKYYGKVDTSVIDILSGAILGNTYQAVIREKHNLKVITGDEETIYFLISLVPIGDDLQ